MYVCSTHLNQPKIGSTCLSCLTILETQSTIEEEEASFYWLLTSSNNWSNWQMKNSVIWRHPFWHQPQNETLDWNHTEKTACMVHMVLKDVYQYAHFHPLDFYMFGHLHRKWCKCIFGLHIWPLVYTSLVSYLYIINISLYNIMILWQVICQALLTTHTVRFCLKKTHLSSFMVARNFPKEFEVYQPQRKYVHFPAIVLPLLS